MSISSKGLVRRGARARRIRSGICLTGLQHRCIATVENASSDTATLPDGRKVGLVHYGSKDGPKVFYLHGSPGSRLEGKLFEPPASKLGVNVIAVDRPGIGLSSPHLNRTMSDHAKDIKDLAGILGFKEYYVAGISGGGPYALACAATHPASMLRGVAVVAGLGPYQFGLKGMALQNQLIYRGFRYTPRLLRLIAKAVATSQLKKSDDELIESTMKKLKKSKLPEKDLELFSDPEVIRYFIGSAREHFRQGFDAWMQDGKLLGLDWDFRIEDITFSPMKLWFGLRDVNIAACTGSELRRILGDKATLHMEEESHASLPFNCREKILADLVGAI